VISLALNAALSALFLAWILTWFGFDNLVIQFIHEWTGKGITHATYYVGAFIIGLILGILNK
jgi:hypothetical protein